MAKRSRRKHWQRRRTPTGASPGTLVPEPGSSPPVIRVMTYDSKNLVERVVDNVDALRELAKREAPVTWVHVQGFGNALLIEAIGNLFGFDRLALADAVNVPQRPKGEDYGDTFFLLMQMPVRSEPLEFGQVSFFINEKSVVSFQGGDHDWFEPVRVRLREARGRIRSSGADYLAYALVDVAIDSFFPLLETYSDRLEELENCLIGGAEVEVPKALHDLRHDLFALRRMLWPLREALTALLRDDSPALTKATRLHLRDAIDHTNQLLDLVEAHHEFGAALMSLHQAFVTQRTNEIVRHLTMMASIFIPLTFIVGIYGMNFDPNSSPWNMPELRWFWGYPAVMLFMAAVAIGMLIYFRKKGWIGKPKFEHARNDGE
jgi:magnesium transporter